jgi:protein involved in polysaccharide export with SLBB domain
MTGRVPRNLWTLLPAAVLLATGFGAVQAHQEPANKPKQQGPLPTKPGKPYDPSIFLESIKPLPLEPIPDNPPPHEGAMFELTYRIDSPDLVLVEVLEALPGRTIQGERLVRPDGTISLQWYGELHITGRTVDQVKTKVILHLRQYLSDESLGLIEWDEMGREKPRTSSDVGLRSPQPPLASLPEFPPDEPALPVAPLPLPVPPANPGQVPPFPGTPRPDANTPTPSTPGTHAAGTKTQEHVAATSGREQAAGATKESNPTAMPPKQFFPDAKRNRPLVEPPQPGAGNREGAENPVAANTPALPRPGSEGNYVYVVPAASSRVFVDVSAYNSKVYYVQGDVGSPGRLTSTGKDTVLDAINYAGGFLPSADDSSIRLFRPARGNQRAREYPINYRAILRGDNKSNLQIFPGDRLVVPRKEPNLMLGARDAR